MFRIWKRRQYRQSRASERLNLLICLTCNGPQHVCKHINNTARRFRRQSGLVEIRVKRDLLTDVGNNIQRQRVVIVDAHILQLDGPNGV